MFGSVFRDLGFTSLRSRAQGKGLTRREPGRPGSEIRPFSTAGAGGVQKMSMAPLITERRAQGHTNQRGLAP